MLDQASYKDNLSFVARATAYNAYLVDSVRAYLGDRVLDVGCGIGSTTSLLERPLVVGMDASEYYIKKFKERLPEVPILLQDISDPGDTALLREYRFDTIFCSNVLEHIEDDEVALSNMWEILEPGGTLILLVPNYPFLFGSMDEADLHFRRYTRASLREKAEGAGFRVHRQFCLNFPGIFWWYVSGKMLKRRTGEDSEAGLINRVMPIVRGVDRLLLNTVGLSLALVGERP